MLKTVRVSISELRNNLASYLEIVEFENVSLVVRNEKRDKNIARILPLKRAPVRKDLGSLIKRTYGMWADLAKEEILGNSPLRGTKSDAWLRKIRSQKLYR